MRAPPRKLADLLLTRLVPRRFIARQLRRPSGVFGRWVMTRGLNRGNRALVHCTLDVLDVGHDDSFLDVGFGGGLAISVAAERTTGALFGVDFSPDAVAAAHRRLRPLVLEGRLSLLTGDVADLPLRSELVQTVCTTNTIYFWPDPLAALRSIRRVLRPGGRLAIGFSGADKMSEFDAITRHGFTKYPPQRVVELVGAAGFEEPRSFALSGGDVEGDFVVLGRRAG